MSNTLDYEAEAKRLASLLSLNILDTPMDNRFERITRLVQNILKVPIASFNLVDEKRQWGKSVQGLSVVEIARRESFCSHVIQGEKAMVVNDARKDARFAENPLVTGNPNIVFYAGCPVHAPDGERIGALCAIDRKPREISSKELQILRDLAGVLESELKLDQLQEQVAGLEQKLESTERVALIDPLTRLWNRNGIVKVLQKAWGDSLRETTPVSIIIADIDLFKKFNEDHGRPAGDMILHNVGKILLGALRAEDSIGRIGGDQFMIVLPGCPQHKVMEIAERIRRETLMADPDGEGTLPITLSFGGVCTVAQPSLEMTELMKLADDAVVEAKKAGRNKTVVIPPRDLSAAA